MSAHDAAPGAVAAPGRGLTSAGVGPIIPDQPLLWDDLPPVICERLQTFGIPRTLADRVDAAIAVLERGPG